MLRTSYESDDRDSGAYIGDYIKGSKFRALCASHKNITHAVISVLILIIFLEFYGGFASAKNFFGTYQVSLNPVVLLIDMGRYHPIAAVIVLALSYIIGMFITKIIVGETETRYEEDAMGRLKDNLALHGRGSTSTKDELSTWARLSSQYDTIGTVLGIYEEDGVPTGEVICKPYVEPGSITDYVNQLKNDHMLLAAPSSSGKTTNFIPHNIINHMMAGHSVITTDPSGELFELLAPVARYLGYKVRVLNLRPDEMHCSDGCDFLGPLRDAADPETMADDFCAAILMNVGSGKQDFWNNANKNLLSRVLLFVSHAKGFVPLTTKPKYNADGQIIPPGKEERTFREVAAYIEDVDALKAEIERAIEKDPTGDGKLLRGRFNTWKTNKEAAQIASGLATSLSIFRNSRVAEVMSQDDMSVELFVSEKCIYFLILDPLNDSFKPITSLYFTTVFQELMRIAQKLPKNWLPRMAYVFLEEFQSLGLITKLPAALDNIRKYNVGIALCTQELAMIEDIYGTATALNMFNDCLVQMCMGANADHPGNSMVTNASYFSQMAGTMTIREDYTTEGRHKYLPEGLQELTVLEQSQRMQSSGADVYMTDDVYRLKGDEVLIRASMHNSIIAKRFYWENHPLSGYIVRDRKTGEQFALKVGNHVPHYQSGSDELFDTERYEIVNSKEKFRPLPVSSGSGYNFEEGSGVSYDEFM